MASLQLLWDILIQSMYTHSLAYNTNSHKYYTQGDNARPAMARSIYRNPRLAGPIKIPPRRACNGVQPNSA